MSAAPCQNADHCCAGHLRRAVQADKAGDFPTAIAAYKCGLELLIDRLKWEKDPTAKAGITAKVTSYCASPICASPSASCTALLGTNCHCVMCHCAEVVGCLLQSEGFDAVSDNKVRMQARQYIERTELLSTLARATEASVQARVSSWLSQIADNVRCLQCIRTASRLAFFRQISLCTSSLCAVDACIAC